MIGDDIICSLKWSVVKCSFPVQIYNFVSQAQVFLGLRRCSHLKQLLPFPTQICFVFHFTDFSTEIKSIRQLWSYLLIVSHSFTALRKYVLSHIKSNYLGSLILSQRPPPNSDHLPRPITGHHSEVPFWTYITQMTSEKWLLVKNGHYLCDPKGGRSCTSFSIHFDGTALKPF